MDNKKKLYLEILLFDTKHLTRLRPVKYLIYYVTWKTNADRGFPSHILNLIAVPTDDC